jgi:DNA-binding response OmpR family regulator
MTAGIVDITAGEPTAAPLRILVADEDPVVRLLVVGVLAEMGHEVRASSNGGDAWRTFEEWLPELVILDVNLPIVDGLEVCGRIREWDEQREVFVLFLTDRDQTEALETVLDAGGDDFVVKPMTPENLRARLTVVSQRMAQDRARRNAEEELSKARWLAGIGDATLALQHEINNPLSALLGHAELMMMELDEQGEKNELLNVIHEQALRIAQVVRRLRRLKNPESVDYVGGSRMLNLWKEHAS